MIYHSTDPDGRTYSTLEDLALTVRNATEDLRPHRKEFDSIVVTGVSGLVVGAPVALRLRKPLVILRKASDDSHSGRHENIKNVGDRALFLDDFVSGGATQRRVLDAIDRHGAGARVVARYVYRDRRYDYIEPPRSPW